MVREPYYSWEAEKKDGEIITKGGDLSECVRFSAIPTNDRFPRHDFIGKQFKNRFNTGFTKFPLFGYEGMLLKLKGKTTKQEENLMEISILNRAKITEKYKAARKDAPENTALHIILRNKIKEAEKTVKSVTSAVYSTHFPSDHYYLCAVYAGGRVYVNAYTGAVLCTPEKYELYI